jgi:glucose/mannose-6-phosphate isomerase
MDIRVDLDDPAAITDADPSGMLDAVEGFPGQVREALRIGGSELELPDPAGVRMVAVLGMGGSGISGDVVATLAGEAGLNLPVLTVKGYRVPSYIDKDSLVFAVSYSGNTEETLEGVRQVLDRGSKVVAVTSGGTLSAIAMKNDLPLLTVPGGFQPRASLGYLFVPILCVLERMGLASGITALLDEATGTLEERSAEYGWNSDFDSNPTKRLAKDLVGFVPVVYGSEGALSVAALRWKAQLNENAKVAAFHNSFPELNHNETVGWLNPPEVCSRFHLIVLRDRGEHPRIEKRIAITTDLLEESVGHITQVCARGSNTVEDLLDLIYFGDFTSVYLALALGEDPTPVERIQRLKDRLSE